MKKTQILDILMLFFGFFVLCNYTVYTVHLIMMHSLPENFIVSALVFLLVLIPTLISLCGKRKLEKRIPRVFLAARIIFICGMAFYTVTFLIFTASAMTHSNPPSQDVDAVIVFGCKTNGYTPSQRLRERLDAAFDILEQNENSICIVSGGKGADEEIEEAEAMRAYLETKGISSDRIIKEDRSTSTSENISYSFAILENMNLADKNVVGISSDFHVMRITEAAQKSGVQIHTVGVGGSGFFALYASLVREYMAYVKMLLF